MSTIKDGSKVKFHYTGKLDDGTIFDSTKDSDPLEFTMGENLLLPKLESEMIGMSIAETKTVELEPEDAYGKVHEELIGEFPLSETPNKDELKVGDRLQLTTKDDTELIAEIKEIHPEDDKIVLDANHQLAGKRLTFNIEVVSVENK